MTLSAHTTTQYTPEEEVRLIPAPQWTPTWHPVSHSQLIDATQTAVLAMGISVKEKQYSINKTGTRMFASWQLDVGNGRLGYVLGFRHATDRSMRIGYVAGTHAFVCDNMCFSGDYRLFRMHTGGLDLEALEILAKQALGGAIIEMEKMVEWQKSLHKLYVPKPEMKQLVFDMVEKGVFSGGQIGNYLQCLEEEKKIRHGYRLDSANSLYAMHGAATRLMRPWSLLRTSESTAKLNLICDDYMLQRAA